MIATLTAQIVTLLLALALAGGGPAASPALARYNQFVAQLHNVGCRLIWPATWHRSVWACPPNQLWTLTLDEANDTAHLRRIK